MKKICLSLVILLFASLLTFAQDQSNVAFYSGTQIDLKKGLLIDDLNEYMILTGLQSGTVEVFLRRGNDAVSIRKFEVKNGILTIRFGDMLVEGARFESGDQVVIRATPKEIYTIPVL